MRNARPATAPSARATSTCNWPAASALCSSDSPVRTTGSKLNHATTLWDYINRAMPFQAPKSLTADEVYALTAYILYLNEIVGENVASLDQKSILQVQMPNRDGFTTQHGFMRYGRQARRARGGLHENCPVEGKIASSIPEHARNAQGNLVEQFRHGRTLPGRRH